MTIALNGVTVDTGPALAPVPSPRAQASLLSALGRADPVAAARLQLPSAVAAATILTALPSHVPAAPKPLQRAPSSLLAAQFIAQDISLTASDLEIFAVRQTIAQATVAEPPVDDYLAALRIARGDIPEVKQTKAGANPAQEKTENQAREGVAAAKTALSDGAVRSGVAAFAAGLPALTLPLLRRISIASIKGVDAYGFALARNATLKPPAEQAS